MTSPPPLYYSYILRLWQAGDSDHPQWRLSLEDPRTGIRLGFARPEEMLEFLRQKIEEESTKSSEGS
jgi:hypothetical protein